MGQYDDNPLDNLMVYEVKFEDGNIQEYSANILAEIVLTQVDDEGFAVLMLDGIVDYKRDSKVALDK